MTQPSPTPAARAFLDELAQFRARWAYQCPAVDLEGAKAWGIQGAQVFAGGMKAGFIESIEDKPCLEAPAWIVPVPIEREDTRQPVSRPPQKQGVLL